MHRRVLGRPIVILSLWIALLGLGLVSVLAQPVAAAFLAERGKSALFAMVSRPAELTAEGFGALVFYVSIVMLAPLVVLVGCVVIERRAADERVDRPPTNFIWLVQTIFLTGTSGLLMLLYLLHWHPEPIFRLEPQEGVAHLFQSILLTLLILIFSDIFTYWLHRAQHHYAWLWKFHAVHHSPKLDVLHSITHPVDTVAHFIMITMPMSLLVRFSATDMSLLAAFFSIQAALNHMRCPLNLGPLGGILCDNRYHFIHHSRDPADYGSNFAAAFPFIDMMFGTYRKPGPVLPDTGIPERPLPATIWHYLGAAFPKEPMADAGRDAVESRSSTKDAITTQHPIMLQGTP